MADLLFLLSGGLARDLMRLIRQAVEARERGKTQLDDLALALIAAGRRQEGGGSCAGQDHRILPGAG